MHLTTAQLRAARALLNWSIDEVSERAGVHRNTVLRAEKGEATLPTLAALRVAFEEGGVSLLPAQGEGEGVRLKSPGEAVALITRKRKVEATA